MSAKKPLPQPTAGPFNNPFAALKDRMGALPAGSTSQPATPEATPARTVPRAVVRYERKGHGGKEVTLIEKLELGEEELARWLKEAKSALGCGGTVAAGALVLQGDQRERVKAWLEARGIAKVSVSG
ncbi:MAG: translation initiation factor [Deltaproteobacteria bacterium]|nr:translation initiation factor [Deltaproteobacteria bacterium]